MTPGSEQPEPRLRLTETPDPRLDALLDEALAPQSVPGGLPQDLQQRIHEATDARMGRRRHVLGRLEDHRLARPVAAATVLAASVGIAALLNLIGSNVLDYIDLAQRLPTVTASIQARTDLQSPRAVLSSVGGPGIDPARYYSDLEAAQNSFEQGLLALDRKGDGGADARVF